MIRVISKDIQTVLRIVKNSPVGVKTLAQQKMFRRTRKMKKEKWEVINGYEDYSVSNFGKVVSRKFNNDRILKQKIDKDGYRRVHLSKNGHDKYFFVHRLVAQAFIPNPDNLPQINHIDECKFNNCIDNLEWCDAKYNNNYGNRTSLASRKAAITRSQPIIGTNLYDGSILKFISAREAGRNGFDQSGIWHCLKGKTRQHHGYKWEYDLGE